MLLDQRSFSSLPNAGCFERNELTVEAAEIDAARDKEVYLGFTRDTDQQICRPHMAHVHADFAAGLPERRERFNDQPVHSARPARAELLLAFDDSFDGHGDDVQVGSMRLKVLHTPSLKPEPVSAAGFWPGIH